ncbi:MAG: IS4 family transposase [Candidatus Binatia bacterium]
MRQAGLGGFLGRKSDGERGTQSLWIGIQCLDSEATGNSWRKVSPRVPLCGRGSR